MLALPGRRDSKMDCKMKQRERAGDVVMHRCLSQKATTKGQHVNDDICAACPVREAISRSQTPSLPILNVAPCEYRIMGNKCVVTGLEIDEQKCNRCVAETKEAEAGIVDKIGNFTSAVKHWVAAGRPVRSDERVQEIYEKHCSKCSMYDTEKKACKSCGCAVNTSSFPLGNKLKMATQSCPLGQFEMDL